MKELRDYEIELVVGGISEAFLWGAAAGTVVRFWLEGGFLGYAVRKLA